MNLHIYDSFSDEDDLEASDFKLYANRKDFVTFFPDNLFGKEGKFFFPRNLGRSWSIN